ncbi:DUF2073 domain-containing protein [Halocalculus aciditolerans]|uniref:DUF2073 domain-containing protein n=1 Tax=Halocalculus aciditolerans TaxID=1383812 RepID=A0A830FEQ5_9EURY|nr:DUF2073 domain-containing protein [Halocalculus aciditolerans]GGL46144.1 hypothetical protein GCM10009039_00660 [Halocalculus aciditolerans]
MAESTKQNEGVQLDLIRAEKLENKTTMEKIRLILDTVHNGDIVVLEKGLTPDEESKLIEVTMSEINPDGFTGIEIESFPTSKAQDSTLFGRLMGKEEETKMTVIGPANQIQSLHKDDTVLSTIISNR